MFELKEHTELTKNDDVYSFGVQITKDSKDISGRSNITAEIKSDDCEIITQSVKLTKNTEIQFQNPTADNVTIYVQPENSQELIEVNFVLSTDEATESVETIESAESIELMKSTEDDQGSEDTITELPETTELDESAEPIDYTVIKKDTEKLGYPILQQTAQVEFDYIFTSQIQEILADEIVSKNAKDIYIRAINTTNKIVFFRDTNTSMYYWISKDKILSSSNFTDLLIEVNQYNKG